MEPESEGQFQTYDTRAVPTPHVPLTGIPLFPLIADIDSNPRRSRSFESFSERTSLETLRRGVQ